MSSNTNALTIDSGGNATAVGVGASTITATGDAGQTATLTVQTVPLYQGNWIGTATVLACTDLVGFTAAGYCAKNLGTTQQVTLSLTQSGLTLSGIDDQGGGGESPHRFDHRHDRHQRRHHADRHAGRHRQRRRTLQLALISWNSISDGTNMTGTWSGNLTSAQILGLATLQWSCG